MANRQKLIHLNNPSVKIPLQEELNYGEIAVQYAKEKPVLYIKDTDDNIIKFIDENAIKKFLSYYVSTSSLTENYATSADTFNAIEEVQNNTYTSTEIDDMFNNVDSVLDSKQDILTSGENIVISNSNVISVSGVATTQDLTDGLALKADTATTYTKSEVDSKMSGVYHYKGTVANQALLPATPSEGDVYNVEDDGMNYAWNGTAWDALGGTVDLSEYYTKTETNTILSSKADQSTTYTKTEVDTALGNKQDELVSGTNIKTINNQSLLGNGNINTPNVQISTLPTASATEEGKIYQYIGNTTSALTNGYFYECVEVTPPTDPKTYEWVRKNVQTDITVDQTYNSNSTNAQSGIAVAEGLDNRASLNVSVGNNAAGAVVAQNGKNITISKQDSDDTMSVIFAGDTPKMVEVPTAIKTINNQSLIGSGDIIINDPFVATYDSTAYNDVVAAIDANKAIVVDFPNNHNLMCATYSTYGAAGSDVVMYAIYKLGNETTLATITLTSADAWSITHTSLQNKLVSGTDIKTVNGNSLLGSGDIELEKAATVFNATTDYSYVTLSNAFSNGLVYIQYNGSKFLVTHVNDVESERDISFYTENSSGKYTGQYEFRWIDGEHQTPERRYVYPTDGTTGQVLTKRSNSTADVMWADANSDVFVVDTANLCSYNELQNAINDSKVILIKHSGNTYPFVEKWESDETTKRYVNIASLQRQGIDKGAMYFFFEVTIGDFDSPMVYSSNYAQPTGKPYTDSVAGNLSNLTTTEKTNLVGAVNEVNGKVGVAMEVGAEKWYGTYTDESGVTYQVYSKIVYIPELPSTPGITTYPTGVANMQQILSIYGFTTDGFVLNAPRQTITDNITIYQTSKGSQTFSIEVGKDRSSKKAYVTMIYAKKN